jgi:hypothetical protein
MRLRVLCLPRHRRQKLQARKLEGFLLFELMNCYRAFPPIAYVHPLPIWPESRRPTEFVRHVPRSPVPVQSIKSLEPIIVGKMTTNLTLKCVAYSPPWKQVRRFHE